MKKVIFSVLFALSVVCSYAQKPIDFFEFINRVDWKNIETELSQNYAANVRVDTSIVPTNEFIKAWSIENVKLGECRNAKTVIFHYVQESQTMLYLVTNPDEKESWDLAAEAKYDYISDVFVRQLGEPQGKVEDMNLAEWLHLDLPADFLSKNDLNYDCDFWGTDQYSLVLLTQNRDLSNGCLVLFLPASKNYTSEISRQREGYDFRKGSWGESMSQIKNRENIQDQFNINNIYSFTTRVAGYECLVGYVFTRNQLTRGKYVFTDLNKFNCYDTYSELKRLMTKKYGDPISDEEKNTAEDYQLRIYTKGELVENGLLSCVSYWMTPTTAIQLCLYYSEYEFKLWLTYEGIEQMQMVEEDRMEDL